MQPLETVATAKVGGSSFTLARRGAEWAVLVDGRMLMSSRQHGSEESLAAEALAKLAAPRDVLVGGLGLGFTLRAVLDRVGAETRVHVAELVPDLVDWNRAHFPELHAHALDDARVVVHVGDVRDLLRRSPARFDAVLLDVDNGPVGMSTDGNGELYTERGVRECHTALRPDGVLAVWSAGPSERYERLLSRSGFGARAVRVAARPGTSARHVIFVGERR
jgi:spermidine synthase